MSLQPQGFTFDRVVGRSVELRQAIDFARRVTQAHTSTVLLLGETGTGKEMFARGIHYEGRNAAAPFVAINCAAIPDALLESELFGHEAGAFTGARVRKTGLMELAGCGTLFLDEVHQLPLNVQPKLLRALEERRIRRLGATQEVSIDCRIMAASNVALERAVEDGEFRLDLFYRLNVLRLEIPSLRQRRGDVEVLARYFLSEMAREHEQTPKTLSSDAQVLLQAHAWPGNVRELKNVIERAHVLSGASKIIEAAHLLIQRRTSRSTLMSGAPLAGEIEIPLSGKSLREIEREAVHLTLSATGGNQSRAAKLLGISRPTLARILREMSSDSIRLVEAS
ncbi:MAG TPA: sigma 54-interacting transcriptional regulator [Gemmatimonadaceae bacterium]